jgi:NADP-dependent 3-hydroxy acid dehydrogenase YdfG
VETEFLKTTFADSTPAQLQEMMALKAQFALLNAVDIANAVLYVIGTPAHVCIRELIISPTEQPPL